MNKKEYKDLLEDLKQFIYSRQERGEFLYKSQKRYKKLSNKGTIIYNKIINLLQSNNKELIKEYENITTQQLEIQCEEEYKKGFKDCANIFKILFIK